jgi:hypothetical protein
MLNCFGFKMSRYLKLKIEMIFFNLVGKGAWAANLLRGEAPQVQCLHFVQEPSQSLKGRINETKIAIN